MDDFYHRESKIKRIKFSEECSRCFQILENFERYLQLNNYSLGRIEKYWFALRRIHSLLGNCFDRACKADIENFVIKVDSNENWTERTKVDFKKIIKFFYKWLKSNCEEYPEEVKWIKAKLKKNYEKTPEQILTREEVELIATKARNLMEKAFVLCLYESACRISEFLNMKIKDVQFDQYGCFILVSGKTGWRRIEF